eukprot:TRINITY_DN500_c0_g1_i4.p2 TRINITY_DN500_c0_g1~~TRINITY_DN500_c0_g1_i4.p2  ORF type:complete len:132 (+),score=35.72 TRINITY_DN500_c0_g1_i4:311-706(+)
MSFFFAVPSPMLNMLTTACKDWAKSTGSKELSSTLAALACGLYGMASKGDVDDEELQWTLLRGMTASIVLFDHVDELGAYCKKSPIPIKGCINLLMETKPYPDTLMSIIKFSSKHLMDDSTPNGLKNLLGM